MLNEFHSMSSFGIEYRALSIFYLMSDAGGCAGSRSTVREYAKELETSIDILFGFVITWCAVSELCCHLRLWIFCSDEA
jgi:hypothetical protein